MNGAPTNNYEVWGSIRTLPSITLYVNLNLPHHTGAYLGIGTGLVTLKNFKAYLDNKPYSVGCEIWAFTPSVGGSYSFFEADEKNPGLYLFGEVSYELRKFSGIDYTLPPDVKEFPKDLPKAISAGGRVMNIGLGFTFRKEKPAKGNGT